MNVRLVQGDLLQSTAQTLVNTVNCVGVMGKGIALEFKKRFPDMFEDYQIRCRENQVHSGCPYLYKREQEPWILNFPTKGHWRSKSRLADIVEGLDYMEAHYQKWGITSLAVPPLGCGNGHLEWSVVGPILYQRFSQYSIPVTLYLPPDATAEQSKPTFLCGGHTSPAQEPTSASPDASIGGRALAEIVSRICREPFHWPVERAIFPIIAYFATTLHLPTDLEFQRTASGIHAEEGEALLKRLLQLNLLQEVEDTQPTHLRPGPALSDTQRFPISDLELWEAVMDRVVDLFLRLSPPQARLAAIMRFITLDLQERHGQPHEDTILREVKMDNLAHAFAEEERQQLLRGLMVLGWVEAKPLLELPLFDEELLAA